MNFPIELWSAGHLLQYLTQSISPPMRNLIFSSNLKLPFAGNRTNNWFGNRVAIKVLWCLSSFSSTPNCVWIITRLRNFFHYPIYHRFLFSTLCRNEHPGNIFTKYVVLFFGWYIYTRRAFVVGRQSALHSREFGQNFFLVPVVSGKVRYA